MTGLRPEEERRTRSARLGAGEPIKPHFLSQGRYKLCRRFLRLIACDRPRGQLEFATLTTELTASIKTVAGVCDPGRFVEKPASQRPTTAGFETGSYLT